MTLLLEPDTLTGVTATHHQIPTPAMPPPGPYSTARRSPGGAIALVVVGLIATAALIVGIVGLTRDNSAPASEASVAPEVPAFSAAEVSAAKDKVCAVFEQTNQAVNVATNAPLGSEPAGVRAGGRAAVTSAALALTRAVSDATPADVKDKANGLADAYMDYALTAFAERPSDTSAVESARVELQSACA